jgi:putative ABC transport system substrate-binding protein
MMDRRSFLARVGALISFVPVVEAQQTGKLYRVGYIVTTSPVSDLVGADPINPQARAFVHALRALGYLEGDNLIIEWRSAEGRFDHFPDIVRELVGRNVDVIVTVTNPMHKAARAVTQTLPIVMGASISPVEEGLVQSLARPGGNITGLTADAGPEIIAKRLELLKQMLPKMSRVAFLSSKAEWVGQWQLGLQAASKTFGITLFVAEHTTTDYADAFALIARERPDALLVPEGGTNYANRRLIVDFAARARLPAIYPWRVFADIGGLMAYGVDLSDGFRRAAAYVDKILKGANPAEMPVERPTKFELVINLKTAKALGLTIPPSLLLRADQVIE